MDTKAQLKALWTNLKKVGESKPSLVLFCIIGWVFLVPFLLSLVLFIWVIRITQIPTDEFDNVLRTNQPGIAKFALIIIAGTYLAVFKYGALPWMYTGYWLGLFFYFPFLWLFTFGNAKWEGLIYFKNNTDVEDAPDITVRTK